MKNFTYLFLIISLISYNNFAKIIDINNKSQLNEALKNSNALIKFSSENCPPCKAIKPAFKKISDDPEFQSVAFIHIDTDINSDIADEYQVSGIPTFVYKQNNKEISRHTGRTSESDLKVNLRRAFNLKAVVPQEQEPIQVEQKEEQKAAVQPKQPEIAQQGVWESIQNGVARVGTAIKDSFNWLKDKIGSLFGK